MNNPTLLLGNCLEKMRLIPDASVDCIIDDLPYQCTNEKSEAGKWDEIIPFEPMWEQFLRVTKQNAAIILFAQGIFTAKLMLSQPSLYRYSLIWDKCRTSGFLNVNRMPLRCHEDILVFYRSLPTYNPQMEELNGREPSHPQGRGNHKETNRCYGDVARWQTVANPNQKHPRSILRFPRPHCTGHHPTEKSVDLCRWLIRSYTNEGETVLDATAGSGTTGVAAILENRSFIGIEKEPKYFEVMQRRVTEAMTTPRQAELF